jgi:hypothetical protein
MSETTPPAAEPPIDPWIVERLLHQPATAHDDDEQALTVLFAALRAPAAMHEVSREQDYLAAFTTAQTLRTELVPNRRRPMLATLLAAKTAVAAAALAALAGAAAAYTGTLPGALQNVAHHAIGAPAANPADQPSSHANDHATDKTPSPHATGPSDSTRGPDASGPAAYGLCTAYTHGGLATTSTAYRSLSAAAGGADQIQAFCAAIPRPGNASPAAQPPSTPNGHATGTPSDHPTGRPSDHPTGQPSDHPTGQPSDHPTGQPSDHPTR